MRNIFTIAVVFALISWNSFGQNADKSKDETITGSWTFKNILAITNSSSGYRYVGDPFDLWVKGYSNDIYVRDIHRSLKYGGTYGNGTTTPSNSFIFSHEWGNSADLDLGAQTVKMRGDASTKKWQWSLRTDSYGGREIFSVNNEGSGRVGINQSNPSEALDVNGNIKTNRLYISKGNGIYSTYNNNYILNDHNNGNVTLSAAGGDLYLGYQNTRKLLLRKSLYDTSGSFCILSESGSINQTKTGVNNYFAGKVGIGLKTPATPLHIHESDSYTSGQNGILIEQSGAGDIQLQYLITAKQRWVTGIDQSDNYKFKIGRGVGWATGADFNIDTDGKIGIGTTSPAAKLHVAGDILAKEIRVEDIAATNLNLNGDLAANNITIKANGNTADFVFSDTYNLKDLTEVESFIKTNKHLEGIPSAEAMEAQGVNLAEMNKLLLQKVEELTLYTVEQEKKLKELEGEKNRESGERASLEEKLKEQEERLAKIEALLLSDGSK